MKTKSTLTIVAALFVMGGAWAFAEGMTPCDGEKGEKGHAASAMGASKGMMNPGMGQKGMMQPPFGTPEDQAYAKTLWKKMEAAGFGGVHGHLYEGAPPHGKVREVIAGTVDGNLLISKPNYRGADVTVEKVKADPAKYLKSVTVMVKKPGYDPSDKDWFWVKYSPDGSILKNKKGMALAGRLAKGKPIGCISCHQSAPGGDFVFVHDATQVTWIGDKKSMESLSELIQK